MEVSTLDVSANRTCPVLKVFFKRSVHRGEMTI